MRLSRLALGMLCGAAFLASADRSIAAPPETAPTAIVIDDTPLTVAESMQQDATIHDITFVDRLHGWAVGDRGVIWHTSDGGATWRQQASGVTCRLATVSFVDAEHGYAAGGVFEPYTHGTRAVFLATNDGGATWKQLPHPTLPAITRIKFFQGDHGIAAGVGSVAEPSGVYATRDGGQTWEPLPSDGRGLWLAADFVDFGTGAVAGPAGQFATLARRRLAHGPASMALTRSYRALQLAPPTGGWLVGDGGLVMTTRDLGATWQTPPGELPPFASEHFDFQTVANVESQVWIAGSPGTRIFHSADNGDTWTAQDTGQPLPIRAITFVDENHGWGAGDLGVILRTVDGGRTWKRQRQGGARAAVLGVFARAADVPLEALAKYGGEEGYLAAADVVFPTADALASIRTADALHVAGATSTVSTWRFPLPSNAGAFTPDAVIVELNRANDGRAIQRLEEHLVQQLRTWRPEIVVTRHAPATPNDPLAAIIEPLLARAVAAAADPVQQPQLAADVGLPPWQVKRVFGLLSDGSRGDVRISAAEFAPRLGQSLADAAAPARELLYTAPKSPPDMTELARLGDFENTGPAARELFADLRLAPGSEARRRLANLPEEDQAKLRQLAARRRQMQALLDRSQGHAAWEAQIGNLIDGLDAASGGELLYQLADGYRAKGKPDLAADTYSALARRWPDHALVDPALRWLVQFYASSEMAHRLASRAAMNVRTDANVPTSANAVRQASAMMAGAPVVGLTRDDRLRRAAAIGQYLESARPAMFAEPSVRFPLVIADRQLGYANPAKRYFITLGGRPENDPWRRCAETEEWFANSAGLPPPKALGNCRRVPERPHLDGQLNEPFWNTADRLRLRFANTEAAAPENATNANASATASFLYDGELLYVAIRCSKTSGGNYAIDDRPRSRDADLATRDRVAVRLDIDRDYTTAYELTVDHRGWTHDACWGDATWNPQWFVAPGGDENSWTIEAAIPLAELAAELPSSKHVWAVSVERSAPGANAESWTGAAAADDSASPDRFGLLIFE